MQPNDNVRITAHVSPEVAAALDEAARRHGYGGKSQIVDDALRAHLDVAHDDGPALTAIYTARWAPTVYIGEDETGVLWLVPASPIGPEAWRKRKPIPEQTSARRQLEPVPDYIARFYLATE